MWKILKIHDRGKLGVFASIYNEDPEHSDTPNILCEYVSLHDLPKYGLKEEEYEISTSTIR